MTDQTFEEKVQKIASEMRDAMRREDDGYPYVEFLSDMGDYIRDLEALLPAPSLPTLADMTDEERRDCKWMQADVEGDDKCILFVIGTRSSKGVTEGGRVIVGPHECFTPRPDLPRLEWPSDQEAAR